MKQTKVLCHHCQGSGKITLSRPMEYTLSVVYSKPRSTQEIARILDDPFVKMTAINNRLAHLMKLGLVTNERRGKTLYWKLA